jgi:Flp pilus assembly pilin Flp
MMSDKMAELGEGQIDSRKKTPRRFLGDERGQDMIEYTLLVAFVALASAAIYIAAGKQVHGIWSQANSTLVVANAAGS